MSSIPEQDESEVHDKNSAYSFKLKDFSVYSLTLKAIVWLTQATQIEVPVMTYESAIKYFVKNRPSDQRIKKGVILRQECNGFQLIDLLLLDENNKPVSKSNRPLQKLDFGLDSARISNDFLESHNGNYYGSRFLVYSIDDELQNAFDGQNIIIVE